MTNNEQEPYAVYYLATDSSRQLQRRSMQSQWQIKNIFNHRVLISTKDE